MTDSTQGPATDRYITFLGLDCDAKARQVSEALREAMAKDGRHDPFWGYFVAKLDGTVGPRHDELYHIHCHLNDLRDLLERWDEPDLAALLETLELDCC